MNVEVAHHPADNLVAQYAPPPSPSITPWEVGDPTACIGYGIGGIRHVKANATTVFERVTRIPNSDKPDETVDIYLPKQQVTIPKDCFATGHPHFEPGTVNEQPYPESAGEKPGDDPKKPNKLKRIIGSLALIAALGQEQGISDQPKTLYEAVHEDPPGIESIDSEALDPHGIIDRANGFRTVSDATTESSQTSDLPSQSSGELSETIWELADAPQEPTQPYIPTNRTGELSEYTKLVDPVVWAHPMLWGYWANILAGATYGLVTDVYYKQDPWIFNCTAAKITDPSIRSFDRSITATAAHCIAPGDKDNGTRGTITERDIRDGIRKFALTDYGNYTLQYAALHTTIVAAAAVNGKVAETPGYKDTAFLNITDRPPTASQAIPVAQVEASIGDIIAVYPRGARQTGIARRIYIGAIVGKQGDMWLISSGPSDSTNAWDGQYFCREGASGAVVTRVARLGTKYPNAGRDVSNTVDGGAIGVLTGAYNSNDPSLCLFTDMLQRTFRPTLPAPDN